MSTATGPRPTEHLLEISLDRGYLPVSYLSTMLRVVQAALREVARSSDGTGRSFSQQPQPVLLVDATANGQDLALRFTFADPFDSTPLVQLSAATFEAFMERFSRFLKGLPQPGLWGESAGGSQRRPYESEVARRLDQARLELRRFRRVRLSYDAQTILIEGNRMELG